MFLHYEWLIKINYLRKNYTFIRNLVHVLYSFFVIVVNLLCDFFHIYCQTDHEPTVCNE